MRHPPPTSHPAHSAKAPAHLLDPHAQRWKHSYHCVNMHGEWGRSWVDVWAPCSCFALLNSCCNLKLSTTPAAGVVCVCPCPSVPPPRVLSVVCSTTFAFDFVPRLPLLSPPPPPPPPPLPPLLGHLRMDKSSGTSSGPASAGAPVATAPPSRTPGVKKVSVPSDGCPVSAVTVYNDRAGAYRGWLGYFFFFLPLSFFFPPLVSVCSFFAAALLLVK